MFLLDTNICIYALNGRHPHLTQHLLSIPPEQIVVSSITVGELEYGAAKSHWGDRTRHIMHAFLANYTVLPFTARDATLFGQLRGILAAAGTPIGVLDLMIAAQGIVNELIVVTHKTGVIIHIPAIQIGDLVEL